MSTSALEQFEAIAALYYKRFHRLAPGKSEPLESYRDANDEENRAQFAAWRASNDCFMDAINRIVALESVLEKIVREYDDTYDGEIHSDGSWTGAASVPVNVMERAKALCR